MTTEGSDGDDLVRGAVSPLAPEDMNPLVKKTTFFPWHRLRKHYIRVHQWCAQTRSLVKRRRNQFANRPLHYLSLPGDDLLDVRALHGALEQQQVRLRYLGFNSTKGAEAAVSEQEVNSLSFVDRSTSLVVSERFEMIGNSRSMAHRMAKELAPFDVVNLDLCGSAANAPPSTPFTVFGALKSILELQTLHGGEWLLFLTTRADISSIHQDTITPLLGCVEANVRKHETFSARMLSELGIQASALSQPNSMAPSEFALAFGLAVGKWLLTTANGAGSGWEVELHDKNFWYGVKGSIPDMLSLSFRFSRRQTVRDSSGLSCNVSDAVPERTELELALGLVEQMSKLSDPDGILRGDANLREKTLAQASKLLGEARYDVDAYRRWIEDDDIPSASVA